MPVLPNEVLQWLQPQPGQTLVDGTFGGGHHAEALAEAVGSEGLVIGLDRDPQAIHDFDLRDLPMRLAVANFCDLPEVLEAVDHGPVHGILLDLGLSSDQLADEERGFSFTSDGPLDLRFDTTSGKPASKLIERMSEGDLADLIYQYGEERHSRKIARRIVAARRTRRLDNARELADLICGAVPPSRDRNRIHPATRTFQALRIAVNEELKSLEIALRRLADCLVPDGRLAIISFHSLEDRQVKQAFRDDERYSVLTKKPIRPNEAEVARNPRARSAKMRVASRA